MNLKALGRVGEDRHIQPRQAQMKIHCSNMDICARLDPAGDTFVFHNEDSFLFRILVF